MTTAASHTFSNTRKTGASSSPVRLYLRAIKKRSGYFYEVRLGSPTGELLKALARDPFMEGCRTLFERGFRGQAELWDSVRAYPRMRGSIEFQQRMAVEETRKHGPRLRRERLVPVVPEEKAHAEKQESQCDAAGNTQLDLFGLSAEKSLHNQATSGVHRGGLSVRAGSSSHG